MPHLLPAALLAATLWRVLIVADHVHSHLLVPARQQFKLGGGQSQAFVITCQNVGPVAVEVLAQLPLGKAVWRARLEPRQRAKLRFGSGTAALVRNNTPSQAVLEVNIDGQAGLTMTYDEAASPRPK